MKIWPFITLGVLLYGSTFSDGQSVKRESNPHPHHRLLDAELASFMPHRVATFAVPAMFRIENIIGDGQDWTKPEGKATSSTTTEDDPDAGEDPGKKLFWTHKIPGVYDPAQFPGWGYQDPDRSPVAGAYPGTLPPGLTITFTDTSAPTDAGLALHTEALTFSKPAEISVQLAEALQKVEVSIATQTPLTMTDTPCALGLINGVCSVPCTIATASLPACRDDNDPIAITTPLGGLPVAHGGDGDPGGGMVTPITGGGGIGAVTGSVPEPSSWGLVGLGFGFLWLMGPGRRKACPRASLARLNAWA